MDIELDWYAPIRLKSGANDGLIYKVDLDKIEDDLNPGIYCFARKYGQKLEILYVGKATNIRGRIKQQLNNVRLMKHIEDAANGQRFVLYAEVVPKPGQNKAKLADLAEKAFIRHYVTEGHDLVNQKGTRIRHHRIVSTRHHNRKSIPQQIFLEK